MDRELVMKDKRVIDHPDRGRGSRSGWWATGGAALLVGSLTLAACNENPLDTGFPQVEIIMDSLEYGRAPLTGEARVTFLIANRGPGIAYFDGCLDPISLLVERFIEVTQEWIEDEEGRPNSCLPGQTPEQTSLDVNQAYQYTLVWEEVGVYRIRVFYGDEATVTTGHFADGQEYAVR